MARPLAKSLFVLLALGLLILTCPATLAEGDDPKALNQQVEQLIEQGKYQEAVPIAERAVEVAKRDRGPSQPETVIGLKNGSVATLELRRSLAIASAKLDRHRAEQTENEAME
jgi:Flp pilus assembly protein TadD